MGCFLLANDSAVNPAFVKFRKSLLGGGEAGLDAQGGLEMGSGFVAVVLLKEGEAEVEFGFVVARLDLQGLLEAGDGFIHFV